MVINLKDWQSHLIVKRSLLVKIHGLKSLTSKQGRVDTQILPKFVWNLEEIVYSQTGRWLAVSDGWNDLTILEINNTDNSQNLAQDGMPIGI